jgi:hypothetical protein
VRNKGIEEAIHRLEALCHFVFCRVLSWARNMRLRECRKGCHRTTRQNRQDREFGLKRNSEKEIDFSFDPRTGKPHNGLWRFDHFSETGWLSLRLFRTAKIPFGALRKQGNGNFYRI